MGGFELMVILPDHDEFKIRFVVFKNRFYIQKILVVKTRCLNQYLHQDQGKTQLEEKIFN